MELDPSMQTTFYVLAGVVMAVSAIAFYVCRHIMRSTTGAASWAAFAGVALSGVICSGTFVFAQIVQFGPTPHDGYEPYVDERSAPQAPVTPPAA